MPLYDLRDSFDIEISEEEKHKDDLFYQLLKDDEVKYYLSKFLYACTNVFLKQLTPLNDAYDVKEKLQDIINHLDVPKSKPQPINNCYFNMQNIDKKLYPSDKIKREDIDKIYFNITNNRPL